MSFPGGMLRWAMVSVMIVSVAVIAPSSLALAAPSPAVTISDLVPPNGSTVGAGQEVVLSGFIETESGIGMVGDKLDVTVKIDGSPVTAEFVVGSKALNVGFQVTHKFAAGSHTVSVTARDVSGHSASAETKLKAVSSGAPSIKISDLVPASGATVAAGQEITLSGFVETDAGIMAHDTPAVDVEVDGVPVDAEFVVGSKALNAGFQAKYTFDAGSHTMTVTALDVLGQRAKAESKFTAVASGKAAECRFVNGFANLQRQISDISGRCITNEFVDSLTGDTLQLTTGPDGNGGMFVWRKADNYVAFTDGYRTWILGPKDVLPPRLNTERYQWETEHLTPRMLREGSYYLPIGQNDAKVMFRLVDGNASFANPIAPDAPNATVTLASGSVWYGDFEGDGDRDAVVVLAVALGGPGNLLYAVPVRDVAGQPVQLGHELLGDRITINGIALGHDEFQVDMVTQGPDDLMSNPTHHVTKSFPVKLP